MRRRNLAAALWLACCGCSLTRAVRPLGAGQAQVGASLGGPLFLNLGPPVPMPMAAVYGRYGLDDRTDVDVGVHLPTVRATGLDAGISRLVLRPSGARPALMLGVRALAFGNARVGRARAAGGGAMPLDPRAFAQATATASYRLGEVLAYLGADLLVQPGTRILRPSLDIGVSFEPTRRWTLGLEARWLAFTSRGDRLTARYVTLGGYGAWALQLGVGYRLPVGRA